MAPLHPVWPGRACFFTQYRYESINNPLNLFLAKPTSLYSFNSSMTYILIKCCMRTSCTPAFIFTSHVPPLFLPFAPLLPASPSFPLLSLLSFFPPLTVAVTRLRSDLLGKPRPACLCERRNQRTCRVGGRGDQELRNMDGKVEDGEALKLKRRSVA